MIDAHCHLQELDNPDISGLQTVICNGSDIKSSRQAIEIASRYPNVWATVGIHPESNDKFDEIVKLSKSPRVVAIGECGLDSDNPRELELLKLHLSLAREVNLPLIVHNRNQDQQILKIVGGYSKVMLHCFTSNQAFADECVKRGWYISFGGILTFKKSDFLREIAKQIPANLILTETDSPYLAPEPVRGSLNEPKNVKIVAQLLANLRGVPVEEVEQITYQNCQRFFNLYDTNH